MNYNIIFKKLKFSSVIIATAVLAHIVLSAAPAQGESAIVIGKNLKTKEVWVTLDAGDNVTLGQLCLVLRDGSEIGSIKIVKIFDSFSIAEAMDILSFDQIRDNDMVIPQTSAAGTNLTMDTIKEQIRTANEKESRAPPTQTTSQLGQMQKRIEELERELGRRSKTLDTVSADAAKYQNRIKVLESELKKRNENKARFLKRLNGFKKELNPSA